MRKQTKVAVVVSAAALLAMGASMTSFAKGWDLVDGEWVYLDSYGDRVTEDWKKSVDGQYYYLDEEGVMATNRLIGEGENDTYYVNEKGIRVTNDWKAVDLEDTTEVNGVELDTVWYYFGSNGKAVKPADGETVKKKSINGHTYFFDEEGRMMSGRVEYKEDKEIYYCGTEDQGYAHTGWQYLETEAMDINDPSGNEEAWFYFKSSGMVKADPGKEFKNAYLDGKWYRFDENGVMSTDWKEAGIASSFNGVSTPGDVESYAASNGVLSNGWVKVTENDESDWYYMVTVRTEDGNKYQGVPFNRDGDGIRAKSIGGKTYAFDTDGKMLDGLQEDLDFVNVTEENPDAKDYDSVAGKAMEDGTYYFEEEGSNKGAMKTGKVTVTKDDMEYDFYFATDGKAIENGFIGSRLYDAYGHMIKAEDGNSRVIVDIEADIYEYNKNGEIISKKDENNEYIPYIAEGSRVVVSSNGAITKSGSKVKVDDVYHTVTSYENGTPWTVIEN